MGNTLGGIGNGGAAATPEGAHDRATLRRLSAEGWEALRAWAASTGADPRALVVPDAPDCNDDWPMAPADVTVPRLVRPPVDLPLRALRRIGEANVPLTSKAVALALATENGAGPTPEAVFGGCMLSLRGAATGAATQGETTPATTVLGLRAPLRAACEEALDRVRWAAVAETEGEEEAAGGGSEELVREASVKGFRLRAPTRASLCPLVAMGYAPIVHVVLHENMVVAEEGGESSPNVVRSLRLPSKAEGSAGPVLRRDVAVFVGYSARSSPSGGEVEGKRFYVRLASQPEHVVEVPFHVFSPADRAAAGVRANPFGDAWAVLPDCAGRSEVPRRHAAARIAARKDRDRAADPSLVVPALLVEEQQVLEAEGGEEEPEEPETAGSAAQ